MHHPLRPLPAVSTWTRFLSAVETLQEMEGELDGEDLDGFLEEQRVNERVDGAHGAKERFKMLGVGTPYHGPAQDVVPREYEVWDKALCYELKHDGDPRIPTAFKDAMFRQFVDSIDRNGSMAPWQKNYAFSLLPKAFGGPEGDYIDTILSKMAPKPESVPYRLTKYRESGDERSRGDAPSKRKTADVSGLGL